MSATLVASSIEFRSGSGIEIADVSYPKRIVTVVAMPYERPTTIHEPGRSYTEVVSRGAFDGTENRGNIKANRDHTWDKPVGKLVAVHPSRREGLVTEVKISPTVLGDETLALCDDEILAASAGFALLRKKENGAVGPVWEDAEVWDRSTATRRLNRLWLDHVAFVPNPAYSDAVVQDVRNAHVSPQEPFSRAPTPNLDRIAFEAKEALFEELNR